MCLFLCQYHTVVMAVDLWYSLKPRSIYISTSVLLSQNCFLCLGSFCLNTNFRIIYSQFSHSVIFDSATPWTAARQASLSITNSRSVLKLISVELVISSNHLTCHPLLLLPWVFPSIRVFSNASVLHIRWPKYWSFSFSISPSSDNWYFSLSKII